MSKLMSDLNKLDDTRNMQGSIVVEDEPIIQERPNPTYNHRDFYILSFLMIVLIALSALSMSTSLKTYTQMEESWADSKEIINTLDRQQKDIEVLRSLLKDNSSDEFVKISDLNNQTREFKNAIKEKEQELYDIKIATNTLKGSMQDSIDELKMSNTLMLKKVKQLNDQVNESMKYNSTILSTY